jgi:hypothetical protein
MSSALFVLSIMPVTTKSGPKAGQVNTKVAVATATAIAGLNKVIGSAFYTPGEEPAELAVGRFVECGLESREGREYLNIVRFVEAPAETTAPALPF